MIWADTLQLPVLALVLPAIRLKDQNGMKEPTRPLFRDSGHWTYIGHQTAGYACNHKYMWIKILAPKSEIIQKVMISLSNIYINSNLGSLGAPPLNEIFAYRQHVNEYLGVDCNYSYHELEEGYYPIDCTAENLSRLTSDELPEDLDDLIIWHSPIEQMMGCIGRWRLAIIGDNCD